MADDALTRKEAEMGKLTREEIETLIDDLIVAHPIYTPQLRALLESVREEALEEAAKVCDRFALLTGRVCADEIRALQHAPARVAEGETVAVMVEDEIWWLIETVDGKAFWAGAEECMWTNSALEAVRFRTKEIARGVAEHFLPTEPFALRDHRWSAWHPALSLMRTVKRVLESWTNAYGEWSEQMPSRMANRLPPAGHVQLLEDITDALSESPAKEQPGEQNAAPGTEEKANPCGRSGPVAAPDAAAQVMKSLQGVAANLRAEGWELRANLLDKAAALLEKLVGDDVRR